MGCQTNLLTRRERQIQALQERYDSPDPELITIYGQRHVGKTRLLTELARDKPAVFFTARIQTTFAQIRGFLCAAAEQWRVPALAEDTPDHWDDAFQRVLQAAPKDRKPLLIIDQLEHLCHSSPEFPSDIQVLWDHEWQHNGNLMLVLCGSGVELMVSKVLGGRAPLYGRSTGILKLEALDFLEAALFHPAWSAEEHARAHFVCGGIPGHLSHFKPHRSVAENLAHEFFGTSGYFYNAPERIVPHELADDPNAMSTLSAVALGNTSEEEIAQATGLSTEELAPHLVSLVQLDHLKRAIPLSPNTKPCHPLNPVAYRIADPLLHFWLRFVEPKIGSLTGRAPQQAFQQLVGPQWESFCGEGFERLCREALPWIYVREKQHVRFSVGEYWKRGLHINVVGLQPSRVDLGVCHWQADASIAEATEDINARAARYPAVGRRVARHVFVRSAPKKAGGEIRVHDLKELYGLARRH